MSALAKHVMTEEVRAAIWADIRAREPLSDDQLDALADVLVDAQLSRTSGGGAA